MDASQLPAALGVPIGIIVWPQGKPANASQLFVNHKDGAPRYAVRIRHRRGTEPAQRAAFFWELFWIGCKCLVKLSDRRAKHIGTFSPVLCDDPGYLAMQLNAIPACALRCYTWPVALRRWRR